MSQQERPDDAGTPEEPEAAGTPTGTDAAAEPGAGSAGGPGAGAGASAVGTGDPAAGRGRRWRGVPIWALALVALLVVAAGGYGIYRLATSGGAASGECAAVTGADDAAQVQVVDCASESATFKVASRKDLSELGCPEGAYREIRTDEDLLCLMPNFLAGKCYVPDDANQAFRVAGCESPESIRISEVIEGTTDPSPCPEGSGLGYPEPPVVFCIETPGVS